jgi:hypothetical protein
MAVVALIAVDCVVVQALIRASRGLNCEILAGPLPLANALVIFLATAAWGLWRRGECRLSSIVFVVVGGAALLLYAACCLLATDWPVSYLEWTLAPAFDAARRRGYDTGRPIWDLIEILSIGAVVTPPLAVPALVGGWLVRRYRVRIVRESGRGEVPPASQDVGDAGPRENLPTHG